MVAKAVILSLGLFVALVSFSTIGIADARQNDKGDLELSDADSLELIRDDARQWISSQDKDYDQFVGKISVQYDDWLRNTIEDIRVETQTQELSNEEIEDAMNYIISEVVKEEDIKLIRESNIQNDPLDVLFYDLFGIQFAEAACPQTTTPIFIQHLIDITGGNHGWYTFNGGNDLYRTETLSNSYSCTTTYVLYFYDEDHPYLDNYYDKIRSKIFHRIHDIERFSISNNNVIDFTNGLGTWSGNKEYDCTGWCHYSTTKPYYGGSVYVSNTWNHMMDTINTNPSIKTTAVYL